jgi:hypothetical protein
LTAVPPLDERPTSGRDRVDCVGKRALLVEQTPTTPAARLVAADLLEIKGRVAAAESTLVAPLAARQAASDTD